MHDGETEVEGSRLGQIPDGREIFAEWGRWCLDNPADIERVARHRGEE
jgi:hypothetical protein